MIVDLFSKQQAKLRGEVPDVFKYDDIPQPLRIQIIHIWRDTLGDNDLYLDPHKGTRVRRAFEIIVNVLCREYGRFSLADVNLYKRNYADELVDFFLAETNPEKVLDAIQLSFRAINNLTRTWDYCGNNNASQNADEAIEELNIRFREHGVGYQFENGNIVRVDSQFNHTEIIKPALTLLSDPIYEGAEQEFLAAHNHYLHGNNEEALNECLKALESTMKIICSKHGWPHAPNATSRELIKVIFDNGLIPVFWTSHFTALRSTLEAGVPTARNKMGGHGQGVELREVPSYVVSYVLSLTASAIVLLVEAAKTQGQ